MAGAISDTYTFDAFGNTLSSTGSTPNNFLFAGEQFDPSLGFYYMRARYYRPATGRFWTRDPIEGRLCCGLSWNPYIYALNNPVNATDPTGRDVFETGRLYEEIEVGATPAVKRLAVCVGLAEVSAAVALTEGIGHALPPSVGFLFYAFKYCFPSLVPPGPTIS